MCGGTWYGYWQVIGVRGLSPRVRGNPRSKLAEKPLDRSIPACAGEPPRLVLFQAVDEVYPRVCGGTLGRFPLARRGCGLSPRVRGNRFPASQIMVIGRSIPACAGEPPAAGTSEGPGQVYPRVCGGTTAADGRLSGRAGLSPRVRGNQGRRPQIRLGEGSIPACAGEPASIIAWSDQPAVYPRVCGGTQNAIEHPCWQRGLSPRVRGNLPGDHQAGGLRGSIPACAGEPGMRVAFHPTQQVYPRVCGGTVVGAVAQLQSAGLSPRVRGNPAVVRLCVSKRRSIPACAGEPLSATTMA